MKTIIRIFILLWLSLNVSAQTPKHEVRAVWLTTIGGIDWPHTYNAEAQENELTNILDQLKRAGINTVDDLINKSEEEMMKVRNLGKKSFDEVKEKLQSLGFDLNSEED